VYFLSKKEIRPRSDAFIGTDAHFPILFAFNFITSRSREPISAIYRLYSEFPNFSFRIDFLTHITWYNWKKSSSTFLSAQKTKFLLEKCYIFEIIKFATLIFSRYIWLFSHPKELHNLIFLGWIAAKSYILTFKNQCLFLKIPMVYKIYLNILPNGVLILVFRTDYFILII